MLFICLSKCRDEWEGKDLSVCHISLGLCVLTHKLIRNAARRREITGKKQQEVDLISF